MPWKAQTRTDLGIDPRSDTSYHERKQKGRHMTDGKSKKRRKAAPVTREWVGASDMFDAMREERQRRSAASNEGPAADTFRAIREKVARHSLEDGAGR